MDRNVFERVDLLDRDLLNILASVTDADEMETLFTELFTASELSALSLRWKLLKDLYSGMPQRKIAEKYGISLCKITRGSKILKKQDSAVLNVLQKWSGELE
ncbi:MAG: Trp family transcriptional regulator [Thermodesulfobacteriota bacterium]